MSSEFEEAAKAAQEGAKAVQEASKVAGKAVDGVRDAGGFLAQFLVQPLREVTQTWSDTLVVRRWENQQRLRLRVLAKLKEMQDLGVPIDWQAVPLRVGAPLLQAAEVTEESDLQELWANLLLNFANSGSGVQPQMSFVSTLRELSPLDAAILGKIYTLPGGENLGILTAKLPELAIRDGDANAAELDVIGNTFRPPEPTPDVRLSLANLLRLGCLMPSPQEESVETFFIVYESIFGRALHSACELQIANDHS